MAGEIPLILTLLVLGFLLLGVEAVIIPGFGIIGILGLLSLIAGCWRLWEVGGPALGLVGTLASLALSGVFLFWFTTSGRARKLVLDDQLRETSAPTDTFDAVVGREGRVVAPLRPSGTVEVDTDRYDAVFRDGAFLDAGTRVKVLGSEHGQLVVEPLDAPPETNEA